MGSEFRWCGLTAYPVGLELQAEGRERVEAGGSDLILGLEHEPVITLGRQSELHEDVVKIEDGVSLVRVGRGGRATLHEPGQLVIYPVVDIHRMGLGVRDFVRFSLEVVKATVERFGVTTEVRLDDPGVFSRNGKMGFIGLQVSRGIVQHGLSLNVANRLERFSQIRPCGHREQAMDSLVEHGVDATPKGVFEVFTGLWESLLTKNSKAANLAIRKTVSWRSW